jgi:UDP-glucuronate 4-epimerase
VKILVTGNAGFIGFHVARALVARGDEVTGIDSVNDYYDPALKEARLRELAKAARDGAGGYRFIRGNLADRRIVEACFAAAPFDRVIHLAAQPGVRHSIVNPHAYVESNLIAFTNILEGCRHAGIAHLTYASTSSVYGANTRLPYSEHDGANHPLQFYAATKRANELMAHAYSHLFALPTTGLRFFTVYGPWGRPDMAYFKFVRSILEGKPIQVFNEGRHSRDFTYIDDIVEGVIRASDDIARPDPAWTGEAPDPASSAAPFRIFNIGNARPVTLDKFIAAIEDVVGVKARRDLVERLAGDMADTFAEVGALEAQVGYRPRTDMREGMAAFIAWFRSYYRL